MSKSKYYTTRSSCRVCGSDHLEEILSLGNLCISDFPAERTNDCVRAPLELVLCSYCRLLQLKHTVAREIMYARHYWYRSGIAETMRAALKDIVRSVEGIVQLGPGDVVLDIGANDGTLLAAYSTAGIIKVGCEPANNLVDDLRKITPYVIHDFWTAKTFEEKLPGKKAKVVTAIAMLYDLDNPNQFVADVSQILSKDGVFVMQLMCLRPMLERNDLGNICHEHLEFYPLECLRILLEGNGLEVFRLEKNNVNGGSYRLYCREFNSGSITLADNLVVADYCAFIDRVNIIRATCVDFIKDAVSHGKKVYVYGASTKGNTILQYFGLTTETISGAGDRSPEKWGRFTVGTSIPIVPEELACAEADYFLLLPWAFLDEIMERQAAWHSRGGKFIVPFPEFRIL